MIRPGKNIAIKVPLAWSCWCGASRKEQPNA